MNSTSLRVMILAASIAPCMHADLIFSDTFPGTTLNPAWQVLTGTGSYSVNNGLQYNLVGFESLTGRLVHYEPGNRLQLR
jgi:hypothetical protein